jgi:CRP-like cAMP-binding protein
VTPDLTRNRVLAAMTDADRELLAPMLRPAEIARRQVLHQAGERIDKVWFPVSGMISLITVFKEGQSAEVQSIGRDGLLGAQLFLGSSRMRYQAVVQVPGHALVIDAEEMRNAAKRSASIDNAIRQHLLYLLTTLLQSTACNLKHPLKDRLARWILIVSDAADATEFTMTQEIMSDMLGANRPAISQAAEDLKARGLIDYQRGRVKVIDRDGLMKSACECYEIVRFDRPERG